MTYHDSANIHLVRVVGYGDSEIKLTDGTTTTLGRLFTALRIIDDPKEPMSERKKAAALLNVSPYEQDQERADRFYRERHAATFAPLNGSQMRRDALDDVRGNAFTWLAVAFVLLCAVLTMPGGIADVLPDAIAEARQ
jgi:hypothetical protein